jgi:hypothetical protein
MFPQQAAIHLILTVLKLYFQNCNNGAPSPF